MRPQWVMPFVCLIVATASRVCSAAAPVLVGADIDRTLRINAPGLVCYDETIVVRVMDTDSVLDLGYVVITDSADPPNVIYLYQYRQTTNTTASYTLTRRDLLSPPRAAPYSFEVWDRELNSDSVTTGTPPAMPGAHLAVVAPVMDGVISQLVPTFQWQNPYAGTEKTTRIDVYEEALQSSVWFKSISDGSTSVTLGSSGGIFYPGRTQLYPNHSYIWTVRSGTNSPVYERPGDPGTNYHRVIVRDWQELHGRFTEYGAWTEMPAPPALVGDLAYGTESVAVMTTPNWGVAGIMGYNTDPTMRVWLSPEMAADPDWSPDGSRLVYATPAGLLIDDLSGVPPLQVAGTSAADARCRWTPDGRIIFGRSSSGERFGACRAYALWVTDEDGANAHPIVSAEGWELCASPSPDGEWVAYDTAFGLGSASSVRLVRYDGSEDHAVGAVGVAGQDPAYVVASLAQPAWGPDGLTLAVVFQARAAGRPNLIGIGLIPAAGGMVTPLFLSPYAACWALPQLPAWSPDGTKVVFASGHHRPDLYDYDTISAAELWVVNADGSSAQPERLTDDYSMTRGASWSGMNTPAGSGVSFRRNDVKLTFETVTVAGMSDVDALGVPETPPPPGYQFLAKSYQVTTTAEYSGAISVEVYYQDADIPAGQPEESLVLLHWENGQWVNITSALDTVGNVVAGVCADLGDFALAIQGQEPPHADFTAVPVSGTAPLTVLFTDLSSGDPTSWQWAFGDGGSSTIQSPSHTYTEAGVYDVTLVASNDVGPSAPMTKVAYITVTVAPPVADFSLAPTSGVLPLAVQFSDLSSGNPTTWAWSFGDGGAASDQNPSHTYNAEGVYTVSLTVSNAGGTSTKTSANAVTVLPQPPVAGFSASPTSGYLPLTVQFTDASSGVVTSWQWDFGDGWVSAEQNPSHTYALEGVYTVRLTAANAGGANTATQPGCITVLPLPPVASFSAAPTQGAAPLVVSFSDTSTGTITSWLWDFGDGNTSTLPSPSHTYANAGYYTVSLTVSNAGGMSNATVPNCIATYQFIGPLNPIDPDGSSIFRKKASVPVRFQLIDVNGSNIPTAAAELFVAVVADDGSVGPYEPAVGTDYAGNAFVYDVKHKYYEFPLATGTMAAGIWSLRTTVSGAIVNEVRITLGKQMPTIAATRAYSRRGGRRVGNPHF